MLRSLKQLYGEKLSATDGEIGTIKDFYFDEPNWAIRYLVVDTGNWLASRKVLISPHSLSSRSACGKGIRVGLTRKKIEKSPSIGSQNPVLREYEEQHHKHYGLTPYWKAIGVNMVGPQQQPETHLHSTLSVTGYLVRVGDETIGHVSDLMVNTENWKIGQLVVKTGHRLSGTDTLISPKRVERISYDQSTVFTFPLVELSQQTPANNVVPAGIIL
jgi:sporulation protein YlmC with PRC-barrel domain